MAEAYWNRDINEDFLAAVAEYEKDPEAWKAMAHPNYKSPKHPRDVNLHNFVAFFNEKWRLQKTEYVPCFSPRLVKVPRSSNKTYYDIFCRTRLLQLKAGANPKNLLTDDKNTYAKAMEDFYTTEECPRLLKEEFEEAKSKSEMHDIKMKMKLSKKEKANQARALGVNLVNSHDNVTEKDQELLSVVCIWDGTHKSADFLQ